MSTRLYWLITTPEYTLAVNLSAKSGRKQVYKASNSRTCSRLFLSAEIKGPADKIAFSHFQSIGIHCYIFFFFNNAGMFCLLIENVPAELRDPFYCDQYEQEHLKPPVTRLLQSSELYCRTYSLLLGRAEAEAQPKDNATLVQLLTQRGIISKDQDTPVTDADLRHKPIKMVTLGFFLW